MKKTILAIATLAILTVGNSFAQKGYQSKGHSQPVYSNARIDNSSEEFKINKLDNIVSLSRKQENEIKKIENYYDRVVKNSRSAQTLQSLKRLESQKQQDILEVLTPKQRQKLFAYQSSANFNNYGKFNRKG